MNTLINSQRLARVQILPLRKGGHYEDDHLKMCAMEAVAYIAGETWSDAPQCACPVITVFMVSWNDSLPSDEDRDRLLKPLIPLIVGTRSTKAVEKKRSYMALDWLIRVFTPQWLDMVPALHHDAKALRELNVIADMAGAEAAGVKVRVASVNAAAARAAAWDAARAAAWHAAGDAAWHAAGDAAGAAAGAAAGDAAWDAAMAAARAAAWDAAWDAAMAAARAAARDAARAALKPTTHWLQASATELVKSMCEVKA